MKALTAFFTFFILLHFSQVSFAQTLKSDTLDVAGVCGMCKKKIEAAAKSAGASFASWSSETKKLVIKYSAADVANIQQSVAAAGYDTESLKATEAAYTSLHDCCKYERSAVVSTATTDCCANGTCAKSDACCKKGQCNKTADCCAKAEAGACCEQSADCCKDGACKTHIVKKA